MRNIGQLSLDDISANWPRPEDMNKSFRKLISTHAVQPLPVYKDGIYVELQHVNAALKNALVEVHFSLRHYQIKDKNSDHFMDSFAATVQQIIVLKEGVPKKPNVYKRKNLLDGPVQPKPSAGITPAPTKLSTMGQKTANAMAGPSLTPALTSTMHNLDGFLTPSEGPTLTVAKGKKKAIDPEEPTPTVVKAVTSCSKKRMN
jgi:hypothetical protein